MRGRGGAPAGRRARSPVRSGGAAPGLAWGCARRKSGGGGKGAAATPPPGAKLPARGRQRGEQRLAQRALDEGEGGALVGQFNAGLGRVHVGVDAVARRLQEDRREGMAAARQQLGVALAHGVLQARRCDGPPVDEDLHAVAAAAALRRWRRQPLQPQPGAAGRGRFALVVQRPFAAEGHGRRAHLGAPDGSESVAPGLRPARGAGGVAAGGGEQAPPLRPQREGDVGAGQRGLAADAGDGRPLGARPGQELAPRRLPREEVAHLDRGAPGGAHGLHGLRRRGSPAAQAQARAQRRPRGAAGAVDVGGGGHAGQGLAAEAEAAQAGEVVERAQLGGGVALEGQGQLRRRHAAAVVAHQQQLQPRPLHRHLDAAGAGVAGVLQQLLDDGGGALDHLAGGDGLGHGAGQRPDGGARRHRRRHCSPPAAGSRGTSTRAGASAAGGAGVGGSCPRARSRRA